MVRESVVRLGEMLSIYGSIHGHTNIPLSFVVPSNSTDWPSRFHGAMVGKSLSKTMKRYRKHTLSSDTVALLEAHHIVWEPSKKPRLLGP